MQLKLIKAAFLSNFEISLDFFLPNRTDTSSLNRYVYEITFLLFLVFICNFVGCHADRGRQIDTIDKPMIISRIQREKKLVILQL